MTHLPSLVLAEHAHGASAVEAWMWAVWAAAALVSGWSIWAAIRVTFRPGETDPDHVKRVVLEDDVPFRGAAPTTTGGRP